jgi:hypothetical protein
MGFNPWTEAPNILENGPDAGINHESSGTKLLSSNGTTSATADRGTLSGSSQLQICTVG